LRRLRFERYVDWALDVPMYFVKRGDTYHDVAGLSFRDLLHGKLRALPGEQATMSDWKNHLSTLFPEVRLKNYLEMRGADEPWRGSAPSRLLGWAHGTKPRSTAPGHRQDWTAEERQALRDAVPRRH
jgi:glutamate--cysteine ligase